MTFLGEIIEKSPIRDINQKSLVSMHFHLLREITFWYLFL